MPAEPTDLKLIELSSTEIGTYFQSPKEWHERYVLGSRPQSLQMVGKRNPLSHHTAEDLATCRIVEAVGIAISFSALIAWTMLRGTV